MTRIVSLSYKYSTGIGLYQKFGLPNVPGLDLLKKSEVNNIMQLI